MVQIIKIDRSNRLGKRFKVILDNGGEYHFGQEFSDGTHPITYIDGASKDKRDAFIKRHLGNKTESQLINNLIPSPSLFSMYLLWNTNSLQNNIKILNDLFKKKKVHSHF
jgi:hypothetical protein